MGLARTLHRTSVESILATDTGQVHIYNHYDEEYARPRRAKITLNVTKYKIEQIWHNRSYKAAHCATEGQLHQYVHQLHPEFSSLS